MNGVDWLFVSAVASIFIISLPLFWVLGYLLYLIGYAFWVHMTILIASLTDKKTRRMR